MPVFKANETWPTARYKLLDKSEVPRAPGEIREVLPEGTEIIFDGMPGPHYEPLDDAAREAVARVEAAGGFGDIDPVRHLSLTMNPDVARDIAELKLNEQAAEIAALRAELAALKNARMLVAGPAEPAPRSVLPAPPPIARR